MEPSSHNKAVKLTFRENIADSIRCNSSTKDNKSNITSSSIDRYLLQDPIIPSQETQQVYVCKKFEQDQSTTKQQSKNVYNTTRYSLTSSLPPTLLLHGLDSSSHTWRNILQELDSKAVALDLRGCGHSPLGDPDDFSPEQIVHDIYEFLLQHDSFHTTTVLPTKHTAQGKGVKIIPFVLVGHSMGGRIAMSFAACYPHLIKALVIEDMDTRCRTMEMNVFREASQDRKATLSFKNDTGISNKADLIDLFEREGYPSASVEKWLEEGRVFPQEDGTYFTEVNPAFRLLCFEHFFQTNHGEDVWNALASDRMHRFPIHVMVAGKGKTICDENSIWWMKKVMKEHGKFMAMHRYENATHSIHNSSSQKFLDDLRSIIRAASLS
jgi:pimeloyl-ACP methyl ester carboxylesterase